MEKKSKKREAFVGKKKMSHRLFFSNPRTGEGGVDE